MTVQRHLGNSEHFRRAERRHRRRPGLLTGAAAATALAVLVGGCTGARPGARSADGGPGPVAATVATGDPVTLVQGSTPATVAIGASRALFRSAPVVVVAGTSGAGAAISKARQAATRLRAPLLLLDGTPAGSATTGGSAGASGTSGPGALPEELTRELTRLGTRTVVTDDPAAADRLRRLPGIQVVGSSQGTALARQADSGLTVLVPAGAAAQTAGEAAAAASASAAGARVLTVTGSDVRRDHAAIAALSKQKPRRVVAVGAGFGPVARLTTRLAVAETGTELVGGGQVLFPGRRLVALYGHPGTSSLGVLGEQGLTASIARARRVAGSYDKLSSVPVVPTFEIIATTAAGSAGSDGNFSNESAVAELKPWVDKANAEGIYVVLDLQPGRSNLLDQAKLYAELLRKPNVGLALDPEWRLGPNQRPLQQIGGADAEEINSVTNWLADLTAKAKLPQKLLVLHQFRLSMIRHEDRLTLDRDEVQVLIHMDGQGTPALKDATWASVTHAAPPGVPFGWKNFYDEDHPMLTPQQTMTKKPTPMMISYQ